MFREIRKSERITEKDARILYEEDRKNREYLKIKPETDMTFEESKAFLYSLFQGEES